MAYYWWYKGWNPEFIADEKEEYNWEITWVLKSWWYSERVTVKMKNDETVDYVKIDKLNYKFTNAMEWFSTANLINFIRKESKKHPYWSDAPKIWHFKKYHWSNWWDLERDVAIDMWLFGDVDSPDVDIVEEDTLKKCFPTINKSGEFLKYINSFVKK